MLAYLIRRLGWAAMLFLVLTMVTYVIFFVIPANTALELCGRRCDAQDVRRVERRVTAGRP